VPTALERDVHRARLVLADSVQSRWRRWMNYSRLQGNAGGESAVRYDDWGVRSPRWTGIRSETVAVSGARVHVLRSDAAADAPRDAPTQVLLHGMAAGGVLMLDLIRPLSAQLHGVLDAGRGTRARVPAVLPNGRA
jgi:hypothetical protein